MREEKYTVSSAVGNIGVGYFRTTDRARGYIKKVLDSGRVTYGPFHRRFESKFASLHDSKFSVFVNSGTSALHIALQSLKERHGWRDGDEVIVPALTFVATINIVLHNRMKPVLCDIKRDDFGINPDLLESLITKRTKAIIPVHIMGMPCDMDGVLSAARRHNLKIIEDSCETVFAKHNGRPVGSMGDIGCFSSYAAHTIVTGVGGLAVTSDPDLAVRLRSLANHGRDGIYLNIDDDDGKTGAEMREIISRRFRFLSVGHSFRATEFEAALGLAEIEEAKKNIDARRLNAFYLRDHLSGVVGFQALLPGRESVPMTFPIIAKNKPRMVEHLEANGIETRDLLPLTRQPVYKGMWDPKDYPVADYMNRHAFYVGCHPGLSVRDLDRIVKAVKSCNQF